MSENAHRIPERDHRVRSMALPCPGCGRFEEQRLDAPRDALRDGEPLAPDPAAAARGDVGLDPRAALPDALRCAGCAGTIPVALAEHVDTAGRLDGCPACGYHTLCIQKDVNPRFGVILVTVTFGALLFSGLSLPWMLAGLVALALLDLALLRFVVRRLLICYRCKAQFRGFPPGPRCRPFDLSTWEAHDPPAEG